MKRDQVPVGNRRVCRFAFLKPNSPPLTKEQREIFMNGGALPEGAGEDVPQPKMTFSSPTEEGTLEGGAIVKDGAGEYHGVLPVTDKGVYWHEGIALDGGGEPLSATGRTFFDGV